MRQTYGGFYHDEKDLRKFQQALNKVADAVARGLGAATAVNSFELLSPPTFNVLEARWLTYRVERKQQPPRTVCLSVRCESLRASLA